MSLREDVLRLLVTRYQQSEDPVVFSMILKRADDLLLGVIYTQMKWRPHLRHVDMRDMYHSSIISLKKAVDSVKENESGHRVISRIYSYVRSGLHRDFPLRQVCEHIVLDKLTMLQFQKFVWMRGYKSEIDQEIKTEHSLVLDTLKSMVVKRELSLSAVKMLLMRLSYGMNYKDIVAVMGSTEQNVREKVERALKKLRERYGIEDEK